MGSGKSIIGGRIVFGLFRVVSVLACCVCAEVPFLVHAQTGGTSAPVTSGDEPLVAEIRSKAEKIRRCNEKAQALWDGLTLQEQAGIRTALHQQPDISEVIRLLRYAQKTEAEAQVRKLYAVD